MCYELNGKIVPSVEVMQKIAAIEQRERENTENLTEMIEDRDKQIAELTAERDALATHILTMHTAAFPAYAYCDAQTSTELVLAEITTCRAERDALKHLSAQAMLVIEGIKDENAGLRQMLRNLEWAGNAPEWPEQSCISVCPYCDNEESAGHSDNCKLAALLKEG